MILVQLALDEEGQCSGFTKSTPVSPYYLMRDLWQGFVAEGLITQVKKKHGQALGLKQILLPYKLNQKSNRICESTW